MRVLLVSLASLVFAHDIETDMFEYHATIDPVVQARVLSAPTYAAARRLGGVYGLCADGINIPLNGGLVCDPPNRLPQICTLVCKQGYYSSGANRDIACADAMCEGQCASQPYDCVENTLQYASRPCTFARLTECTGTQPCLETVEEECKYSFYEEVRRPCCNLTQVQQPEGCWTSGCSGNCQTPGVYHYYSSSCGDVCPPWQDPPNPAFACAACRVPTEFPPHVRILSSNARAFDPPSEITVGCEDGYWGPIQTAYCMTTDGSFYPPADMECNPCSAPPDMDLEMVERIVGLAGRVEFRCRQGYVGDSTFSECHKETGEWNHVEPPYCMVAPSPGETPSISPTSSLSLDPDAIPSPSPTPSESATESPTRTPSVSKSPRPPKVKGSRAPSPAPKLRVQS